MLRIFHTADWHLGQTFHNYSRDYEHGCFLSWLLVQIKERKPDVLLVAGDVFDSINPAGSAQKLYYDFLRKALDAHSRLQMVLTAGNHDAASRLESPSPILSSLNVHVVGTVERSPENGIDYSKFLIPLRDASGAVAAIAVAAPYLRVADMPRVEAQDCYVAGMRAFYQRATEAARRLRDEQHPGALLIGMGHCHLMEGAESRDSERRLVVGGLEAVRAEDFPEDMCYVALGHLHKPQAFQGGRVQYSGSPIPLSFTEREYRHRVLELEFSGEGLARSVSLEIPRSVPLLSLPSGRAVPMAALEDVLKEADFGQPKEPDQQAFLEVRYLDDGPDPTRRRRVEEALKNKPVRLASTKFEALSNGVGEVAVEDRSGLGDLGSLDALDVLNAAYKESHPDGQLEPAVLAAFQEILAGLNE
jgi:exonuclease SbcD